MGRDDEGRIAASCISHSAALDVLVGLKRPYGYEIIEYRDEPNGKTEKTIPGGKAIAYETDLVIVERKAGDTWKPRIIRECKIDSVTTHDAITDSQKASSHKSVHPYLRYGILLGHRAHNPLPGRLYRHGMFFDFMMSFVDFEPNEPEMVRCTRLIHEEIEASRKLEAIICQSRKRDRPKFALLHRRLELQ